MVKINYSIIDSKLKSLILVCKESGNYKKIAVVSFILLSNILDDIGIKLGFRPRDKTSEEQIFRYMKLINSVLTNSIKITLFNEDVINEVKEIEVQFLRREGNIPFEYIKKIFETYYNIRKLDIPNLHENFKDELEGLHSETDLYSLMSPGNNKIKGQPDKVKSLILHKIREKEKKIQNELRKNYEKGLFESLLYLQKVKSSLRNEDKSKIELKGQLKNNINYQRSLDEIYGYCLIGVFTIFFLLGLVITIEAIFHPSLTATMSPLFLITYGMGAFFFILYWNYYKKEV